MHLEARAITAAVNGVRGRSHAIEAVKARLQAIKPEHLAGLNARIADGATRASHICVEFGKQGFDELARHGRERNRPFNEHPSSACRAPPSAEPEVQAQIRRLPLPTDPYG